LAQVVLAQARPGAPPLASTLRTPRSPAMGPRRAPALGFSAAAVLVPLVGAAAAAPHFDCRPGTVAFETVHLPDRNAVVLSRGPGCPLLAPRPPLPVGGAPEGAAGAEAPALVDDAPGGAFLSPASALHSSSPQGRSADLERRPAVSSAAAIGVVLMMLLVVAISHNAWERTVRQPKLLAQKAAEEEAGAARLASEEAELRARQEELEEMARAEAERRAREEAEQKAREEAAALAQRLLQEQEKKATEARRRAQYDDHTHAYQLARQEEEERRQRQEKDAAREAEQPAGKAEPERKGRCGPCGCSSGRAASEPARRPGRT